MWANFFNYLYVSLVVIISIYGLQAIAITILYLLHYRDKIDPVKPPEEWPLVAVQLPFYNEHTVAGRMVDVVCAFDYPKDKLIIQVLDDSTDQTTEIVSQRIQHFRSLGFQIQMLHRNDRHGFKAGALDEALAQTNAEYIAIFDADFLPPPNFLKRVIPQFSRDPCIGMVQTRWGHANRDASLLTRTQALLLDGHQVVEQVARSRSHLFLNFNGTGGVWRSECLRDSGGWKGDTLAEDVDASYRAQLKGWRMYFMPDFIVPGELPLTMRDFKKQQNRWTFGHIQVFRKTIGELWTTSGLSFQQRLFGTFHLSTNLIHLAALASFLLTVPLALLHPSQPSSVGLISMASTGPTILFAVSQIFGYKENFGRTLDRLIHLPMLILVAIGFSLSNCVAVLSVFAGRKMVWSVTPKNIQARRNAKGAVTSSSLAVPTLVWMEIALSIYCAVGFSLAIRHAPELIPITVLGMLSFGYVGCWGLVEHNQPPKKASSTSSVEMAR